VELEKGYRRDVNFVNGETNKEDETDDDHSDDVTSCPAVGCGGRDVEWEKEYDQAGCEEKDAED
jgi:hypothetical protein